MKPNTGTILMTKGAGHPNKKENNIYVISYIALFRAATKITMVQTP